MGKQSNRRNGTWLVATGAVQAAVALGANLILVRHIDASGFGRFALDFASIGIVYALLSLRLSVQIIRDKQAEEQRELYTNAIRMECIIGGALVLSYLLFFGHFGWPSALLLVALSSRHFLNNAKAFYERQMPYRQLSIIEASAHFGAHLWSVALVLSGVDEMALYLREFVLSGLTFLGLMRVRAFPAVPLRLVTLAEWRLLIGRTKGLWADGMLESMFQRFLVLAAGVIGGTSGAGFFFQAQRLAGVPAQLFGPIAGRLTLNTQSRAASPAERARLRSRVLMRLGLPAALMAVACVLLADPVVPWLLGPRWWPTVPILIGLSGFVAASILYAVIKMSLIASGDGRGLLMTRLAQYLGLLAILAPCLTGAYRDASDLGFGLSLAFSLAFLTGLWRLRSAPAVAPA